MADLSVIETKLDSMATSLSTIEDAIQESSISLNDIEAAVEVLASNSSVTPGGWSDVEILMQDVAVTTTPVVSDVLDLGEIKERFWVIVVVSYPVNVFYSASIEGSFDGTYWWGLVGVANNTATQSAGGNSAMQLVEGKPSRYLRASAYSPSGSFTLVTAKAATR